MIKKSIFCILLAITFIFSSQTITLATNKKAQSNTNFSLKKVAVEQKKIENVTEGEIKAVVNKKTGTMITVVSNSKNAKFKQVVFNVTKDTQFIKGTRDDLKNGCKVKVTYGMVMTSSLPPQTNAFKIEFIK
ncbi:MAG: hypothetical protein N2448_04580 [Caloramator sp.]|nr:hypothetical protein [Caloramator sp.]